MPYGERLPGVLWPWAGSRRMSIEIWISCLSDSFAKTLINTGLWMICPVFYVKNGTKSR